MKLKTRLKISFLLMGIMPVIMVGIIATGLITYEIKTIDSFFNIKGTSFVSFSNPIDILTNIANELHTSVEGKVENNLELLEDFDFLRKLDMELSEKAADIVVRKNGEYIYLSSTITKEDARKMLPDYGDINDISENGIYYSGDYKCIVRQIDLNSDNGDEYSVSILTRFSGIASRMSHFWVESLIVVIAVLFLISAIMVYWLYKTTIIPLNDLSKATKNISEGNLDFKLVPVRNDEIGQLCNDFELMRKRLKQNAEEKLSSDRESKELISNISHDLKTPITAIKGYVEGLRDGVAVTEEKRDKYLRTIYNKAVEMDRLIDELTLYSKIDTNRIPYSFNKISVVDYFDDCSDSLGVELESKGISFSYSNVLSCEAYIIADTEQLGRVINNIVSNSVKYRRDVKTRIDMSVKDEGDYIRVEIRDNGIGISKGDLPYIFDRMYRADSSRNSATGGSGIGLAIVKKIIEDHGGRIWAESKEGEGTVMCFVLRKYLGGNNE